MDRDTIERVNLLTPLSIYLDEKSLGSRLCDQLIRACHNRAVLLTEISDCVLIEHFNASESQIFKIKKIQTSIYQHESRSDLEQTCRHIKILSRRSGEPINEWLARNKPDHYSWIEMAAAGAPITAWHLAYVISGVFSGFPAP